MPTPKQYRHAAISLTPAFRQVILARYGHEPFQRLTVTDMSLHSYSRCWLHLVWGTLGRDRSHYLSEYAEAKRIYMKINHVNADHVHALIDLPTGMSIEEVVQLLKGSSSDWINTNDVIAGKFAWGEAMEPSSYQNPT